MRHSARLISALALLLVLPVMTACSTSTKVERIEPGTVTDVSGNWNDTDSRLVSEEMIGDMLSRPWIESHRRTDGDMPTVIVGDVRNLSHEHINVKTFIADMERELINSGRVEFVASSSERTGVREERRDQDVNAREDTRNAMGREIGADYMLTGTINTIVDAEGRRQVTYYQVDLSLISMADNRKVWLGQKKIKKDIERASVRR